MKNLAPCCDPVPTYGEAKWVWVSAIRLVAGSFLLHQATRNSYCV